MDGQASWDGSEIALYLFTTLWVCFIKNIDINLFSIGKPKTGTKLIESGWEEKTHNLSSYC